MERRVLQVVLVPDSRSRDLLLPVPDLVNGAQDAFNVSLSGAELALDAVPVIDVTEGFAVVGRAKAELGLLTDDLLVMFTPAILEARSHGLTNLFVAGSSIAEKPPRVGILSSSFIRSHILPRDPTYTAQRDALCHLLVCAVAGAFLDMEAHSDRGCVLDFNNFTPNIRHKVDNRYRFCDQCFSIAHHHSLGDALLNMCRALALGVHQARQTSVNAASGGRSVFLCYVRENIDATLGLFAKLQRDGFRPWMDTQSLVPGQEWRSEIGRAIREAGFFGSPSLSVGAERVALDSKRQSNVGRRCWPPAIERLHATIELTKESSL